MDPEIPTTNQQPVNYTTQSPLTPQKKKKIWIPILITFLLTALVFGIGGYYLAYQNIDNQIDNFLTEAQLDSTSSKNLGTNNTESLRNQDKSNWLTYTNSSPSYTIMYPPDWIIDDSKAIDNSNSGSSLTISKGEYSLSIYWPSAYGPNGCIFEDQTEFNTFPSDPMPGFQLCKGDFKQFGDGLNSYRRQITPRSDSTFPAWNIYSKDNDSNYFVTVPPITYSAPNDYDAKEIEMMDSILSTFKSNNQKQQEVIEFFDAPDGWFSVLNGVRTNIDCYEILGQKIGSINKPIKEYFLKEYNYNNVEDINNIFFSTPQFVWQGVESYTFPSWGIGEVNTIYIRPGEDQWYRIKVNYIGPGEGPSPDSNNACSSRKIEIESILKNIKFL